MRNNKVSLINSSHKRRNIEKNKIYQKNNKNNEDNKIKIKNNYLILILLILFLLNHNNRSKHQ